MKKILVDKLAMRKRKTLDGGGCGFFLLLGLGFEGVVCFETLWWVWVYIWEKGGYVSMGCSAIAEGACGGAYYWVVEMNSV